LLRTALLHQRFSQNFIYGCGDSPLRSHLKSRLCQAAIADPVKNGSPYFDIFTENIAVIDTSIVYSDYLF